MLESIVKPNITLLIRIWDDQMLVGDVIKYSLWCHHLSSTTIRGSWIRKKKIVQKKRDREPDTKEEEFDLNLRVGNLQRKKSSSNVFFRNARCLKKVTISTSFTDPVKKLDSKSCHFYQGVQVPVILHSTAVTTSLG